MKAVVFGERENFSQRKGENSTEVGRTLGGESTRYKFCVLAESEPRPRAWGLGGVWTEQLEEGVLVTVSSGRGAPEDWDEEQ